MASKVVDSRLAEEGNSIRRRRECENCKKRFTTYERIERINIMVIKKDKTREYFDFYYALSYFYNLTNNDDDNVLNNKFGLQMLLDLTLFNNQYAYKYVKFLSKMNT